MNTTTEPQRIVVVEDNASLRRLFKSCLDGPARQIDLRPDGPTGLEAILDLDPDVVILDIALPGMNGWQLLRTLRAEYDNHVAVVVVTAIVGEGARERAEVEGADAFMTKPFKPDVLREVVDGLVGAV